MSQLGRSINELQAKKLTDKKVLAMIDSLYPVSEDLSEMQKKNNLKQQETLKACYFDAPDLQGVGKNGYRQRTIMRIYSGKRLTVCQS